MRSSIAAVLFCIALIALSACAGAPIEPPRIDVFDKAVATDIEMSGPAALPARPRAVAQGQSILFGLDGAAQLQKRDKVCEANTEVAAHCAAGFGDLQRSCSVLLDQARLLERQHNYLAERWAEGEDQLRRQQREQLIEGWLLRGLLAVFVVRNLE